MQNEIPAGTKVKVAVTQKGVTTFQDAEVLAHMDGLVHVNLNGDAVSVDPSQIVIGDAPIEGMQSTATPPAQEGVSAVDPGNAQIVAELIAALTARVAALESKIATFAPSVQYPLGGPNAPVAQLSTTDEESTAPVASAEPAGEGQAANGPEATAGATGQ
jgi:hypothetical protein